MATREVLDDYLPAAQGPAGAGGAEVMLEEQQSLAARGEVVTVIQQLGEVGGAGTATEAPASPRDEEA